MEGVTIEEIAGFIALLAGIITGLGVIFKFLASLAAKWLSQSLKPLDSKLDLLHDSIKEVDLQTCKNFLVRFLADIEQGQSVDEVERERFYEVYERYRALGGNSYIMEKVGKLQGKGEAIKLL